MVLPILFRPTPVDEELHLATTKSLSFSSSSEDDTNKNAIVHGDDDVDDDDDDDHTIPYDNTTLNHQTSKNNHTRQQELFRLVEQRIWQTSPSSVVPILVVPAVLAVVSNTTLHTTTNNISNNNNGSSSSGSSASHSSSATTTALSIPTLRKASTTRSCTITPTIEAESRPKTTALLHKPFFIMDFLEDIDPTSLALVQERLQQQQQQQRRNPKNKSHRPTPVPTNVLPVLERHTNINDTNSNNNIIISTAHKTSNRNDDNHNDTNLFIRPQSSEHYSVTSAITNAPTMIHNNHTMSSSVDKVNDAVLLLPPPPPPFLQQSIVMGQQYHDRGWRAAQCGQWNRAIHYWEDALEIQQQIQPYHPNANPMLMADTYHHIGIAYGKLEQYHDALQYLNKALEIRIDAVAAVIVGDNNDTTTSNTTAALTTTTKTATAASTTQQQQQQQQLHVDIATSLYVIGDVYQTQNQLSMALQFFIQCKLLQEELIGIIPRIEMARTCIAIGHTYAIGQSYSDAYEAYQDAMMIFHQWGIVIASSTDHQSMNNFDDDYDNDHDVDVDDEVRNRYYTEYKATLSNLQLMEQKK